MMNDFVAVLGPAALTAAAPGEQVHRFPWGALAITPSPADGQAVAADADAVQAVLGRPGFCGGRPRGDDPARISRRVGACIEADDPRRPYGDLSGLFVGLRADPRGLRVLTDPLGLYPVYLARTPNGAVLGTHPERVAGLAGQGADFDPISLAEILIRRSPTFPHTTRRGMRELGPGSLHACALADGALALETTRLWTPDELDPRPPADAAAEIEGAVRAAADIVCDDTPRVAVLLSGGADSRTVLGAVPPAQRALALTLGDHADNREVRLAERIAASLDTPWRLALRPPSFYAELGPRETALVGAERAIGNAHALALRDALAAAPIDVLVGGFLCDTLLKGYMQRAGGTPWRPDARALAGLRPAVAEAVVARSAQRHAELKAIRPTTAGEWIWFYPGSRQSDMGHSHALQRLAVADELFVHRPIVDIALRRTAPPIADVLRAFRRISGPAGRIPNANTGAPLDAGPLRSAISKRLLKLKVRARRLLDGQPPWKGHGAWPIGSAYRSSEPFAALRRRAAACDAAADALAPVLGGDPRRLVAGESPFGPRFDAALPHLMLFLQSRLE